MTVLISYYLLYPGTRLRIDFSQVCSLDSNATHHFHDADGDLSDNNVAKIFGLPKVLQMIL